MNHSLLRLLSAIALWSLFYSGIKYFYWGFYQDTSFSPSLERLAGLILVGSMFAYISGPYLFDRFGRRIMLKFSCIFGIFWMNIAFFLPSFLSFFFGNLQLLPILFSGACIALGYAYSIYVIGKNTLIGESILSSKQDSSVVGAKTTIVFIVFLIFGTLIGAKIGDTTEIVSFGVIYFSILLIGAYFFLSSFSDSSSPQENSSREPFSFSEFFEIIKKYGLYMIALSCFWQVTGELSQVAIVYAQDFFQKSNTQAASLLLYSSVGAIIGNILSARFSRWKFSIYLGSALVFSLLTIGFPFILQLASDIKMYSFILLLSAGIGFFFGIAINISESHFFELLGNWKQKDTISALYGGILSFLGACIMFLSEIFISQGNFLILSVFLGSLSIISGIGGYFGLRLAK